MQDRRRRYTAETHWTTMTRRRGTAIETQQSSLQCVSVQCTVYCVYRIKHIVIVRVIGMVLCVS